MNYLIDSYTIYAASTMAANAVLRAVFAAVLWVISFFPPSSLSSPVKSYYQVFYSPLIFHFRRLLHAGANPVSSPLFTNYMYRNLGVQWASSIPAFLSLACVPFPFLFYKYGLVIRERCKYAAEAKRGSDALEAATRAAAVAPGALPGCCEPEPRQAPEGKAEMGEASSGYSSGSRTPVCGGSVNEKGALRAQTPPRQY